MYAIERSAKTRMSVQDMMMILSRHESVSVNANGIGRLRKYKLFCHEHVHQISKKKWMPDILIIPNKLAEVTNLSSQPTGSPKMQKKL